MKLVDNFLLPSSQYDLNDKDNLIIIAYEETIIKEQKSSDSLSRNKINLKDPFSETRQSSSFP